MKNKKVLSLLLAVILIAASLSGVLALPAEAAGNVFTVDTIGDLSYENGISLRRALEAATTGDTITFDKTIFPANKVTEITLTTALPNVPANVLIQGHLQTSGTNKGKPAVSIARRIAQGTTDFRILSATGSITLFGLEIKNGRVSYYGGGVYSSGGGVTATNCTFTGNQTGGGADRAGLGGGVYASDGNVTATNCTFTDNGAYENYEGGAIGGGGGVYASNGNVTATNCTFTDNYAGDGGGVDAYNGNVTAANCTFTGNESFVGGSGVNVYNGNVTATNCTFTDNAADEGGGVNAYDGNVTATNCIFTGNRAYKGGGVYASRGNVTVADCAFTGNTANYGGGVYAYSGDVTVADCAFTGNESFVGGTMEAVSGSVYLYHTTIAKNTGRGVYVRSGSARSGFYAYNSIITGNSTGQAAYGSTGTSYTATTAGKSLIQGIGGVTHAAVFGKNVPNAAGILKPLIGGSADKKATALTAAGIVAPRGTTKSSIISALKKDITGAARKASGAVTYGAVETPNVPVTKITITGVRSTDIIKGETVTLKATVTPDNATDKAVTWSSSNTEIATVNSKGRVTAKAPGRVKIKATAKDGSRKSASVTITVHQYVTMQIGKTTAIMNGIKTSINDAGTKPFKVSGKTVLPLRFVGEKMGGKVKYVSDNQPITMSYGNTRVEFKLGDKKMKVISGSKTQTITLDVPAQKVKGKTYIPLRAISQALGFDVYYKQDGSAEYIVVNNPTMTAAVKNARLSEAKSKIK